MDLPINLKDLIRTIPDYPKEDIAASFQKKVAEILKDKTLKALDKFKINRLTVVGGVSANSELRKVFNELRGRGIEVYLPDMRYTGDNAAMIAYVGSLRYKIKKFAPLNINAVPSYPLEKFGADWT
jgi:N6-L-threonylcarbamoyladenine synthase